MRAMLLAQRGKSQESEDGVPEMSWYSTDAFGGGCRGIHCDSSDAT